MASVACGIDPGISGALAFLDERANRIVAVYDMPLLQGDRRTEVDFLALVAIVERHSPRVAVTEDVWGVAGCGAKSSFNFGAAYGCLVGAFAYMRRPPLERVRPQVWQGTMFPRAGLVEKHDSKDASRFTAAYLYPDAPTIRGRGRTPDHNRCDAVLIAAYAALAYPNASDSDTTRKIGK